MTDERLSLPSASGFHADYLCPGRQNLIRAVRESSGPAAMEEAGKDDYAARGTRLHDAWATGNTLPLKDEGELDAYNDACRLESQLLERWQSDFNLSVVPEPVIEERLWLNHAETLAPIFSGKIDRIYISGVHGLLPDLKSGSSDYAGPASAAWQLRAYSMLCKVEWPQLRRIRAAFIKPENFGSKLDWVDFTEFDLQQIETAVRHALWRSSLPDAPLNAGEHCRWCPALSACPAVARYALSPVNALAAPDDTKLSPKSIESLVAAMPVEAALEVWRKRTTVKNVMDKIAARLAGLPADELDRLGLKLTTGKSTDKLKDVVGWFNSLREAGWSSVEIFGIMDVGKTKFVEAFMARTFCRKAEAEAFWESQFDPFIERGRGNPSLVDK